MLEVAMKTLTIRGVDAELDRTIKERSRQEDLSVNQWVLRALRVITGREKEVLYRQYHDLDSLAGGWSKEETATFQKNTRVFKKIDEEIWK
jgi:hypothetical protein